MQVIEACDRQMARDKAAEDFFSQYTDGSEDELYNIPLVGDGEFTCEKFVHEVMKSADLSY